MAEDSAEEPVLVQEPELGLELELELELVHLLLPLLLQLPQQGELHWYNLSSKHEQQLRQEPLPPQQQVPVLVPEAELA